MAAITSWGTPQKSATGAVSTAKARAHTNAASPALCATVIRRSMREHGSVPVGGGGCEGESFTSLPLDRSVRRSDERQSELRSTRSGRTSALPTAFRGRGALHDRVERPPGDTHAPRRAERNVRPPRTRVRSGDRRTAGRPCMCERRDIPAQVRPQGGSTPRCRGDTAVRRHRVRHGRKGGIDQLATLAPAGGWRHKAA